jgi:Mg-chelatase subunit ChlI
MNPQEGELRPQLSDRIGLRVLVEALADTERRADVILRREAFAADQASFAAGWQEQQDELAASIQAARDRVGRVSVAPELYRAIARLVTGAGVASHRADITVLQCAKALAALDGRDPVQPEDILEAASLALGHRVAVDPFEPGPALDERILRHILDEVLDVEASEKKAGVPARPGHTRT